MKSSVSVQQEAALNVWVRLDLHLRAVGPHDAALGGLVLRCGGTIGGSWRGASCVMWQSTKLGTLLRCGWPARLAL